MLKFYKKTYFHSDYTRMQAKRETTKPPRNVKPDKYIQLSFNLKHKSLYRFKTPTHNTFTISALIFQHKLIVTIRKMQVRECKM